jgi:hypothetical protein
LQDFFRRRAAADIADTDNENIGKNNDTSKKYKPGTF